MLPRAIRLARVRARPPAKHIAPTPCRLISSTRTTSKSTKPQSAQLSPNEPLSFPCLDALDSRTAALRSKISSSTPSPDSPNPASPRQTTATSGPEPSYTAGQTLHFTSETPLLLDWGGVLPSFNIAYETWGSLNADKSNAILLGTGLSASSHAKSTEANPRLGWWEAFIGPGKPLDTDKWFVVCSNVLGGCYGSTGPGSRLPNPSIDAGHAQGQRQEAWPQRYATRFPILTMQDMVRAQFRLLDHLGIEKLYASVGSSMGGMQSLASGVLEPDRIGRVVSISGCARSHPYSIAMRHTQRQGMWNGRFL